MGKSLAEMRKSTAEKNLERAELMDSKKVQWRMCFNCAHGDCIPQSNSTKENGAMLAPVYRCEELPHDPMQLCERPYESCGLFQMTNRKLISSTWLKGCEQKSCNMCHFVRRKDV